MRTSMRTHACGALRGSDAGQDVALCGWVAHRRDHGGVTFIDLRDREGVVQVVFHPTEAPEAHAAAQRLGSEDVIRVTGAVRGRPEGMVNPALPTGDIEVAAAGLEILAEADTPPFQIEDFTEANELLRLKYRYLDLRRPEMTRRMLLRHDVSRITRDHLNARGFVEVETPILTRSTPEGARDFLVPSRLSKGSFYALPQSPQQLKQLLMIAGQDRYYQIVRCFRDEDGRADRQFEFTQLDIEMSFIDEEDIVELIEPLMVRLLKELRGVDVSAPFPRMSYADMIERFGSDKPDLRYGMELVDLASVFATTGFNAFAGVLSSGGRIEGICAPGGGDLSRKELDALVQDTKGRGAAGLVWMVVEEHELRSPVAKFLTPDELDAVKVQTKADTGDLILIVADKADRVAVALDGLRRSLAVRLNLIPDGAWAFCWQTDPPLFEWSEEESRWTSVHHLFTAPKHPDNLDPATAIARGYDLVLNGFELGGGSIRIHQAEVQRRVCEILGLEQAEIDGKFGHLLEALRYGAPPHGGVAFGWDRVVMLLADQEAITEVIAFPKTQSGADPLTGAPATVSDKQLRELGIHLDEPRES
ncbi:MAG: aspartyl-tRNA synthetase [Actinomycetota bacterium]|nr:aspartyl-tRNA synthetase [Actinomycetota bacterium]